LDVKGVVNCLVGVEGFLGRGLGSALNPDVRDLAFVIDRASEVDVTPISPPVEEVREAPVQAVPVKPVAPSVPVYPRKQDRN